MIRGYGPSDSFKDSDLVEFRLPRLVHCADAAAAALMVEMGLGTGEQPWRYQFRRKFIISMDGNGATCSRVAIALRSRSVLVKYGSPYELYYSGGLAPWLHYIPVERDAEVADLVRMERESPGRFQGHRPRGPQVRLRLSEPRHGRSLRRGASEDLLHPGMPQAVTARCRYAGAAFLGLVP